MAGTEKVVIIIPARCGSVRVPLKNVRKLMGRPLIEYTIDAARKSLITSLIYVSTDCDKIASVAHKAGAEIIMRPVELATSTASTESVLIHALQDLKSEGISPEWIMTLPPTSPLRTEQTIKKFYEQAHSCFHEYDSFFSVHENRADFWLINNGQPVRLFPDAPRRQQDRQPLLEENSAIYLTKVTSLMATQFILGNKCRPIIIDSIEGFDINTEMDFLIAEALMQYLKE